MLTPCDSPPVLPPYVAHVSVRFDGEPHDAPHGIPSPSESGLPEAIARSAPKRRVEYVAGRHCAREAVRSFLPGFEGDIATDSSGAPRWPAGLVGSITHTHGFASAAVVETDRARGVGIDTERVLRPSALRAVTRIVARPDDPLPATLGLAEAVFYALLFSAKESLFKCLSPLVGRRFGFQQVRVAFARQAGTLRVTLVDDLSDEMRAGRAIEGRWLVAEPFVHTAVVLEAR